MKIATTPPSSFASWRGPYTLAKRSETFRVPCSRFQGAVLLARQLGRAVGGQWPARVVLAGRTGALPVDRAARRAEDDGRAGGAGRLEHAQRPQHVHLGVEVGPLDGGADVGLRGEVEDRLRTGLGEDVVERLPDVSLVEDGRVGHVQAVAGGEVVDDVDLVAARQQRLDEMRADESRACDDRSHRLLS